jgi:hypothetical protein
VVSVNPGEYESGEVMGGRELVGGFQGQAG